MILFQLASIILFVVSSVFCNQAWPGWWPQKEKLPKCPNPNLLHPCICLGSRLVCEDLHNEERLRAITQVAKDSKIIGVEFERVSLRFIPEDAFQGLNIKFLAMKNSGIMALSDTDQAFIGLENTLESFTVDNCPYASKWEWYHLSNLTKLNELKIVNSELFWIDEDFLSLSQLPIKTLTFMDTSLHSIYKTAFSGFTSLQKVFLDRNELTEISRDMFPRPAKTLTSIGLARNNIRAIPEDMFGDMPALTFLRIGSNPLYVLNENTFKPIWKNLAMFIVHNASLICDCRLAWLTVQKNDEKFVLGTCTTPVRLKGKEIFELETKELWCASATNIQGSMKL